jgi:hypothetical protein
MITAFNRSVCECEITEDDELLMESYCTLLLFPRQVQVWVRGVNERRS